MRKRKTLALMAGAAAVAGVAGLSTLAVADSRGSYGGGYHGAGKHGKAKHAGWHKRGKHGGKAMYRTIARFDANDDGKLTQEEVDTTRKDLHAKHDADKDGKLSLEEFETLWVDFTNRRMVRAFQRIDTDGDAVITLEEYQAPMKNIVARRDRNDDKVLDAEDRRGKKGRGKGSGWLMKRYDANNDGKLTQEEIDTTRKDIFAKHDANKDGKLDLAEFKARWVEFTDRRKVRGFQRIDTDGDAGITVEEYLEPFSSVVARMDRNEDGVLDMKDRKRGRHKGSGADNSDRR